MPEQFEQDDREALLRAMAKRVHNREVGVFAGHDDFGTCASCEESVTAVLAAGFRRSLALQQVSADATVLGIKSWRYGEPPVLAGQRVSTRDEVRRGEFDEMERLARRLRDRGFPKLAPIVRSDLVLRAADAIDALVARVRAVEEAVRADQIERDAVIAAGVPASHHDFEGYPTWPSPREVAAAIRAQQNGDNSE